MEFDSTVHGIYYFNVFSNKITNSQNAFIHDVNQLNQEVFCYLINGTYWNNNTNMGTTSVLQSDWLNLIYHLFPSKK